MLKLKLDNHKPATKRRFALEPRNEWVLIEKVTPEEKVVGGIVVNMEKAKSYQARVLAIGNKVYDLEIGQLVLVSAFPIEIEDVEELISGEDALTDPSLRRHVFLLREEEIYCRVRELECT